MSTMYTERDTIHTLSPSESRLIGIHGFAQSGKDTVAAILKDHGYRREAFADPIREALEALNPILVADRRGRVTGLRAAVKAEGWDVVKSTYEGRRLLQVMGTEVGRQILGDNVWIDLMRRKIGPQGKFIITDVRFINETKFIRELGGTLIKVRRPGYAPVNGHVSDSGLGDDLFDQIIINDGTIDDLRAKVVQSVLA